MKKYISILLILILALGSIIYLFLVKSDLGQEMIKKTKGIQERENEISKIILTNKTACPNCPNGVKEVILERKKDNWYVNEKFIANENQIELLLTTIEEMKVKRPIGVLEMENVLKRIDVQRTKVELFSNTHNIKNILVGGNTADQLGTYMIIETEEDTLTKVFHIPGFSGYLNSRFSCEETNWRDKKIFNLSNNEIKKIEITDYTNPKWSFIIEELKSNKFRLIRDSIGAVLIDDTLAKKYFKNFNNIFCEKILSDNVEFSTNEVKQRTPFLKISISLKNDSLIILKGIRKNSSERGRTQNSKYDTERFYGEINNDLLLIQYQNFNEILKINNVFNIEN